MSRSDEVYLQDIIDAIDIILTYSKNKTELEFASDQMLQDAVIRRFEIIGEASTKISEIVKNKNQDVQWRLMKGMRNKLIHEYFGVSAVTIYSTIKIDLPILKEQLKNLVK
ncbi:MAG TPA: HepT-like ribonuclease domain-containing protein [Mucilaginibacter sp.]|jgi:uncharacterized protein with HEPN domain